MRQPRRRWRPGRHGRRGSRRRGRRRRRGRSGRGRRRVRHHGRRSRRGSGWVGRDRRDRGRAGHDRRRNRRRALELVREVGGRAGEHHRSEVIAGLLRFLGCTAQPAQPFHFVAGGPERAGGFERYRYAVGIVSLGGRHCRARCHVHLALWSSIVGVSVTPAKLLRVSGHRVVPPGRMPHCPGATRGNSVARSSGPRRRPAGSLDRGRKRKYPR